MTTNQHQPLTFSNEKQNVFKFHSNGNLELPIDGKLQSFICNDASFENPQIGLKVYEHVGVSQKDKNYREDFSWATAIFKKGGSAPEHWHENAVEEYYIVAGSAKVTVQERIASEEGKTFRYGKAIEHLRDANKSQENTVINIPIGAKHKIENIGSCELRVVEKCIPAWRFDDYNLDI